MSPSKRKREIDYCVRRTARERWGENDRGMFIAMGAINWPTVGAIPEDFQAHLRELWRDRNA